MTMHNGFYKELDELRKDDPEADFGCLENVDVTPDRNAFRFLHGFCDEFAAMLSDVYGYEIEAVRHFDEDGFGGKLIHAYCVSEIAGEKAYIDIRGITTDVEKFFEAFENEVTYYPDGELWDLEGQATMERWASKDELFDGDYEGWSNEDIRQFIFNNGSYYNVAAQELEEERKPSLEDKIREAGQKAPAMRSGADKGGYDHGRQ